MNSDITVLTDREMTTAWRKRDASYDGVFFFGVKTTGVFCRPSCPSRPRREHLEFFRSAGEAVQENIRSAARERGHADSVIGES